MKLLWILLFIFIPFVGVPAFWIYYFMMSKISFKDV
jgi:hypothetical protein